MGSLTKSCIFDNLLSCQVLITPSCPPLCRLLVDRAHPPVSKPLYATSILLVSILSYLSQIPQGRSRVCHAAASSSHQPLIKCFHFAFTSTLICQSISYPTPTLFGLSQGLCVPLKGRDRVALSRTLSRLSGLRSCAFHPTDIARTASAVDGG